MSNDARSVKRRRVASDHEFTLSGDDHGDATLADRIVPSKTAAPRPAAQSLQKPKGGPPNLHRGIVKNGVEKEKYIASGVLGNGGESPRAHEVEEEEEEPRRSGRQRKPSAKILSIKSDVPQVATPKKPRPTPSPATKRVSLVTATGTTVTPISGRRLKEAKAQNPRSSAPQSKKGAPIVVVEANIRDAVPPDKPFETPKKGSKPTGRGTRTIDGNAKVETPKSLRFDAPDKGTRAIGSNDDTAAATDDHRHSVDVQGIKDRQATVEKLLPKLQNHETFRPAIARIVRQKLAQRRPIPLTHLQDEYIKVHTLLESTITAGEGNSMVLVGARGSGKTALVNQALVELSKTQREHFHVVRLSGFIQTDDKLALREIWCQLGREMALDEDASKSYADTLTMLLALLSHPDEMATSDTVAGESGEQVAKSVIIVMDEFDLFATHARQTLLYNLLDIAQSRKAPIAVIGLTTKFDVTERLEKRVKSRFSHRYVHLPLARSMRTFQDICQAAMMLHIDELSFEERILLTKASRKQTSSALADWLAVWNASVEMLFADDSFHQAYLWHTFHLTKSVPAVLTSLLLPISSLPLLASNTSTSLLPVAHFLTFSSQHTLHAPSSSLALVLPTLSELQLSLLIAAARLEIIHDTDTCSFGMAYAHYVELASKARLHSAAAGALATGAGARVWGRDVAKAEWEVLLKKNLLMPVAELGGSLTTANVGSLVKLDVRLEEIAGAVTGMTSVMHKWCKQM